MVLTIALSNSVADLRGIKPEHLGAMALPVAELIAWEHATEYSGFSNRMDHPFALSRKDRVPGAEVGQDLKVRMILGCTHPVRDCSSSLCFEHLYNSLVTGAIESIAAVLNHVPTPPTHRTRDAIAIGVHSRILFAGSPSQPRCQQAAPPVGAGQRTQATRGRLDHRHYGTDRRCGVGSNGHLQP